MSETLYHVQLKADPSKTATANWQNASELVSHGFWEWASGGDGSKEFSKAKKDAKVNNTKPQGFDHLDAPEDGDDDEDEDERGSKQPKAAPVEPVKPIQTMIPVTEAAKVDVEPEPNDGYEDMDRDELFAAAEKAGLKLDKRLGTKNLIVALRAPKGTE
jgi:hypothetical protein